MSQNISNRKCQSFISFILQVVIYNRNIHQERLTSFEITVGLNKPHNDNNIEDDDNEYCGGHVTGSQLPSTVQNARVPLIEITCANPIDGRYVTIQGKREGLTLCEVQVYAEPSKNFRYLVLQIFSYARRFIWGLDKVSAIERCPL